MTAHRDQDSEARTAPRRRQRGQVLVIFAAAIVVFIGLMAIVIDVSWYWANTLSVQRAADAAALAGVVKLPDDPNSARTLALAAAKKNGYTPGAGVTVTAVQNPTRDIQLDTTVSAPVPTFFMKLFGINTLQATRSSAAEYVLPVPMGSPLNYFGAFGALRSGGWIQTDTTWLYPTATMTGQSVPDTWVTPNNAYVDESNLDPPVAARNSTTANTTDVQGFTLFRPDGHPEITNMGMPAAAASAQFVKNGGIEVVANASSSVAGCQLQAQVSSNANLGPTATWWGIPPATSPPATGDPATLTITPTEYTFGNDTSTGANDRAAWWRTTGWTVTDFTDARFAVRIKAVGAGACATATTTVDYIAVRVSYEEKSPPIKGPHGEPLNKQGVWAVVNSQGADAINGDIYSPQYNGKPTANTEYQPSTYYDYGIEMQPGSTNGSLYVFDPVFCATNSDGSQGMGDRWYSGNNPMSTFYDLYDTNNTPYDLTDDTWIAGNTGPSGSANPLYGLFRRSRGSDQSQGGPAPNNPITDCQRGTTTDKTKGAYYHNRWWRLTSGIAGPTGVTPRVYRMRVTSTDLAAPNDQSNTNAQNSFSLFASVSGHTCPGTSVDPKCPRIFGLGTMQAFTPLQGGTPANLYLSQIGAVYAGKTIKISLWDPGDANGLQADLSFGMPCIVGVSGCPAGGYKDAPFTWTAKKFATGGQACTSSSSGTVTSLRTNNAGSGTGIFNGCWVTINIAIPSTYTAPTPPGEPGPGWWKIKYTMGGSTSVSAYDLTTWKTQIIGNPVHLVIP